MKHLGITYPYAVISDVHLHLWQQFGEAATDGTNSRLQHILDAIEEVADRLQGHGGKDIIISGDLFHTRGKLDPIVFNAAHALFTDLTLRGFRFFAIPGNHDCVHVSATTLGNSFQAFSTIKNFHIFNMPTLVDDEFLFIPWNEDYTFVKELIKDHAQYYPNGTVICHVGLSGVLSEKISHSINPWEITEEDLRYVFCGHFHNHASFNDTVFSVGALTHQTFGDVNSKAGFLIVYPDRVEQYETSAPLFVDFDDSFDPEENKGNFVRLKDITMTTEEVAEFKEECKKAGVGGVLDQSSRPTIESVTHEKLVEVDMGLNKALESYTKHKYGENWEKVYQACLSLKK